MNSTNHGRTEQLDGEVWLAKHALRHPVMSRSIALALFTTPELLHYRLDLDGKAAGIAAHQVIVAASFVESWLEHRPANE